MSFEIVRKNRKMATDLHVVAYKKQVKIATNPYKHKYSKVVYMSLENNLKIHGYRRLHDIFVMNKTIATKN